MTQAAEVALAEEVVKAQRIVDERLKDSIDLKGTMDQIIDLVSACNKYITAKAGANDGKIVKFLRAGWCGDYINSYSNAALCLAIDAGEWYVGHLVWHLG